MSSTEQPRAGEEEIVFKTDDPARFVSAFEPEDRHLRVADEPRAEPVEAERQTKQQLPRALLKSVQAGVLDSLYFAMRAWFAFYFTTGEGTGQARLSAAITGLRDAGNRLQGLADQLSGARAESVTTYRDAVEGWARSMAMLAEGVESDNQVAAQKGLSLLVEASNTANEVVRRPLYPNLTAIKKGTRRVFTVGDALNYIFVASPPRRVSKAAMRHAKQPWERAIIAAGSPFRRL